MNKSSQIDNNSNNNGTRVGKSPRKGKGVFATRMFKTGETVIVGKIEIVLEENTSHAAQIGINKYVLHAEPVPTVNHSCDPNCGISVNETGGHDFVAMKYIKPGEEITFDYAMRNYSIDYFSVPCVCGSSKCRGYISGWKNLPDAIKKAYRGFVAPYLLELDSV